MKEHKVCCLTGHRPGGFPWDYYDKDCAEHKEYLQTLYALIEKLIAEQGFDYFISGGAIGADTDFAEAILFFKKKYPHIMLEIAVPCRNQDLKWNEPDKAKYKEILDKADTVTILSEKYTRFCMQRRNEYMVDKSDFAIAVWNSKTTKGGTYNTIKYIERKHKEYDIIDLDDFTEDSKRFNAFMDNLVNSHEVSKEDMEATLAKVLQRLDSKGK